MVTDQRASPWLTTVGMLYDGADEETNERKGLVPATPGKKPPRRRSDGSPKTPSPKTKRKKKPRPTPPEDDGGDGGRE